jgi:hypothetical protein
MVNRLDFAKKETRRAVTEWREWRRESGDARVAAVTLTIVPKGIEARIIIAGRKAVNRFLKKVFWMRKTGPTASS